MTAAGVLHGRPDCRQSEVGGEMKEARTLRLEQERGGGRDK